jgi:L-ascorbate metabolism protein UlaG (beta-lactamase superfamily)
MLNYELFCKKIETLKELLPFGPKSSEGLALYYGAIAHLSDDRFNQVIRDAAQCCEKFPTPSWMLDSAKRLAELEDLSRPQLAPAHDDYVPMPAHIKAQFAHLFRQTGIPTRVIELPNFGGSNEP